MLRANRQYFVVKIDKKLQEEKRSNLVSKNIGYLGIKHSKQDDDDQLNGVRVWDVEPQSPAWDAAFKNGDIITRVNDEPVTSYEQLSEKISLYKPGETITIHYINSFSIDRSVQSKKKVTLGTRKFEVVLPQTLVDFQFNLQFGEVVEIGSIAHNYFPQVDLGDILIFHHTVEGKPRSDGDTMHNDFHLIDTDENGDEYRIVNFSHEVYGVLKQEEGIIIPYKNFVFCRANIRKASMQMSAAGVWLPDSWDQTAEELQEKIEKLNAEKAEIMTSNVLKEKTTEKNYRRKEELDKTLREIMLEQRNITRKIHEKRFVELTVLFVNPGTPDELQYDLKAGDTIFANYFVLYPLDLFGVSYTLIPISYIEGVIHQNPE